MTMSHAEVNEFENGLREVEGRLEALGRSICSAEGSIQSWNAINGALEQVRAAIHGAYRMRPVPGNSDTGDSE